MISFEFDHTDFHSLLQALAARLGTTVENGCMNIPPLFGKGYVRALRLPNGLGVCIMENTVNTDILLKRVRRDIAYFILAFDDVRMSGRFRQIVAGETENIQPPVYAGVSLGSTLFDNTLIAYRNFSLKGIRVMFPASWLSRYFGIGEEDDLLADYLSCKTRKLTLEPLDMEYRNWMDDIFQADLDSPVYLATIENRVMMMMERFFSRLEANVKEAKYKKLDKSDIYTMMKVEADISHPEMVDLPSMEVLAERYGLPEAKLKRLFRDIYGYPIYQYFQRCRLDRARELLMRGGHSVKEAGLAVGFKGLSNFSRAFRHVYGILPVEMLKQAGEWSSIPDHSNRT